VTDTASTRPVASGRIGRVWGRLWQWPGVLLILTAIFWAGNTVAGRLAVGHVSPMTLVILRWTVVLAVLWPIYGGQVRAHWSEVRPRLGRITLMAFLGYTAFNVLYYWAAYTTTAINIGILQGSIPVAVLMGAFVMHGTRARLVQIAGVLVTSAGVVVVATEGAPLSILDVELNRGDLAMLAACVLYAFYTVALRDRPNMPGAAFFTLLALIAALTSIPPLVVEGMLMGFTLPSWQGWLVILYVAVFPSCLAQLCYLRGVDLIGPGRAGVYVNLVPVFSAIMAVLLIDEKFALFHGVALALVLGGIWLAQRTAAR
jgi:drug/metabolite transporter (DMT)-like permease